MRYESVTPASGGLGGLESEPPALGSMQCRMYRIEKIKAFYKILIALSPSPLSRFRYPSLPTSPFLIFSIYH